MYQQISLRQSFKQFSSYNLVNFNIVCARLEICWGKDVFFFVRKNHLYLGWRWTWAEQNLRGWSKRNRHLAMSSLCPATCKPLKIDSWWFLLIFVVFFWLIGLTWLASTSWKGLEEEEEEEEALPPCNWSLELACFDLASILLIQEWEEGGGAANPMQLWEQETTPECKTVSKGAAAVCDENNQHVLAGPTTVLGMQKFQERRTATWEHEWLMDGKE